MLKAEDLPPFQRAVSYESQRGQRVYTTLIALRLSLLLVAAVAGVATWKLDNSPRARRSRRAPSPPPRSSRSSSSPIAPMSGGTSAEPSPNPSSRSPGDS